MTTSLDIWIFGLAVAAFFLVGLPLIRAKVFVPARMDFQELSDDGLTPAQRTFFQDYDERLSACGYRPLCAFKAANLQGPNVNRLYAHGAEPGVCLVSAMTSDDGVEELKLRHDSKIRDLGRVPKPPGGKEEIFRRSNELHGIFCEFQRGKGLLRLDPEAGLYRATYRTGLMGIRNYLNPFADNFTWTRLALGLGAGVGLPASLAALYREEAIRWLLRLKPLDPGVAAVLVAAAAYLAGGFLIGLIFSTKAFIWGFLLGWATARLLPDPPLDYGLLGLAMACAAELGWRLKNRLGRLA